MECKEVTQLLDNLDVEPLSGDEEINDDLLSAFTDFYEKLVLSGNLKTLVTQLESVKDLEENDATKCAIMFQKSAWNYFLSEIFHALFSTAKSL